MTVVQSVNAVAVIVRYEYHWCDGVKYKKPTKLPASQYISLLMDWIEQQINNEEIFPVTVGQLQSTTIPTAITAATAAVASVFGSDTDPVSLLILLLLLFLLC